MLTVSDKQLKRRIAVCGKASSAEAAAETVRPFPLRNPPMEDPGLCHEASQDGMAPIFPVTEKGT